jgi:hypothetical protein
VTAEQRLVDALHSADDLDPSEDLWTRVLYSIEEDGAHRARVHRVASSIGAALVAIVAFATLSVSTDGGTRIGWVTVEALETAALLTLTATLGPAIRRFGRGLAADLLGSEDDAGRFLAILDVAYYLVFCGYILVTARLAAPASYVLHAVGSQIEEAAARIAGLLLVMGLLHAATMTALPIVALVRTATNRGAQLPRWVTLMVIVGSIAGVGVSLLLAIGLVA